MDAPDGVRDVLKMYSDIKNELSEDHPWEVRVEYEQARKELWSTLCDVAKEYIDSWDSPYVSRLKRIARHYGWAYDRPWMDKFNFVTERLERETALEQDPSQVVFDWFNDLPRDPYCPKPSVRLEDDMCELFSETYHVETIPIDVFIQAENGEFELSRTVGERSDIDERFTRVRKLDKMAVWQDSPYETKEFIKEEEINSEEIYRYSDLSNWRADPIEDKQETFEVEPFIYQ